MKNSSIVIGVSVLVIIVIMSIIGWFGFKPTPIVLQGEVEATEVHVATKLTGRMISKNIEEGQQVKKGDTLLNISSPEVHAKMQQVLALQAAATAQNKKADNGAREEQIRAAKNLWLKAQAAAKLMEKTYNRVNNLYKEGVVPEQKRDEAKTRLDAANLTVNAAKSSYDMALKGTRVEDKMAAKALVQQASGAVSEVEAFLSETAVVAPISAEVSSINSEVGELVTAGFPVVSLVDLNNVWFTFNVREDYLSKFKMGTEFNVKVPAINNKIIKVKVTFIKNMGEYATWRATKASGEFDKKVFEVRAKPINHVEGLRPGMSALLNWNEIK